MFGSILDGMWVKKKKFRSGRAWLGLAVVSKNPHNFTTGVPASCEVWSIWSMEEEQCSAFGGASILSQDNWMLSVVWACSLETKQQIIVVIVTAFWKKSHGRLIPSYKEQSPSLLLGRCLRRVHCSASAGHEHRSAPGTAVHLLVGHLQPLA